MKELQPLVERGYGTVAVDFDATIAEYKGWQGLGVLGDPLPGCKEALDRLMLKGYTIIIFTTRGEDLMHVEHHLRKYEIPYHFINRNRPDAPANVSACKVLADVYIDDRAITFDGRWEGMVERVESFIPWYKRENKRPSINLMVAGYHVDQISLYVNDINTTRNEYSMLGHDKWVIDTVQAEVLSSNENGTVNEGHQFTVGLAFNYTMFPCEFELIQVLQGKTIQIPTYVSPEEPGLSHYGFHVEDLSQAILDFELCGYRLMTHVRTVFHEGCPYVYEYAFMDTRTLGFISKLIWRVTED